MSRYGDVCDAVDGQRFRVRAEILDNHEDYITVQMGCYLEGVITLPWAEYSSATLEIQWGSRLDLARKVKTMIRRSADRLGYSITAADALRLRGSDEETHLLMSNKEWRSLNERPQAHGPLTGRNRPAAAPVQPFPPAPAAGRGSGYYAQSSAEASRVMSEQFAQMFPGEPGPAQWADEGTNVPSPHVSATPPPSQQRGSQDTVEAAHGRGASSSSTGGGALLQPGLGNPQSHALTPMVNVPGPTGTGPGFVPAPTTSGG
jgi:hypothetical protein